MTKEFWDGVYKIVMEILATEKWDATLVDKQIAEQLCQRGIFANNQTVKRIRNKYDIPNNTERKYEKYRELKANGKKVDSKTK